MRLIDHVSFGVANLDAARQFYDAIMDALGAAKVYDRPDALGYGERCSSTDESSSYLAVYLDLNSNPESRRHWCFKASTRQQVDMFYSRGLSAGGQCQRRSKIRPGGGVKPGHLWRAHETAGRA